MNSDAKSVPTKPSRRPLVLALVLLILWLVLCIVFWVANWFRALEILFFVTIFFSIMGSLRGKPIRRRVASAEEGKETSSTLDLWGSLFGSVMSSVSLWYATRLYVLDWHELVLPTALVFAICMLAWLPFALRNPKRTQALLAAVICAVCVAPFCTIILNYNLDDGTPISTEARYLGESQRQYADDLKLPDGSVVGVEFFYYQPKVTPLQPNDTVDFKCYQGPLGIRYTPFHDDDSWKGNPFAIAYHRWRDWLSHRQYQKSYSPQ